MRKLIRFAVLILAPFTVAGSLSAQDSTRADRFTLRDIFALQWAADPQISPDGQHVAYERSGFDIMKDRERSNLWIVDVDGSHARPLTSGAGNDHAPRWSPDGKRILYVSTAEGRAELYVRWMDSGQQSPITHLEHAPASLEWSPDGKWIAFSMWVPETPKSIVHMPPKPDGADWGPPVKYIDKLLYRRDGRGYVEPGHVHMFIVPADGGAPRQVTSGPYDDGAPHWTPDGKSLLFAANRHDDAEYDPLNAEIYELSVDSGAVHALTNRAGPDNSPAISPDGKLIAYTGFDDKSQGYQVTHLYVMNRDGSGAHVVTGALDRDVNDPQWSADGRGVYVQYDDEGDTKVGLVSLDGKVTPIVSHVGGLDLGRPYGAGQYTVSRTGRVAFTETQPDHPAEVAVSGARTSRGAEAVAHLTRLNEGLLSHKTLGAVQELRYKSSFDGRAVEGWIITPPGFDASKKYPLLLEIHGGPYADYGDRWSAELQFYAQAGYVVLYTNPRGSTSYGETFGNLINHDYPNHDYDDLMSGVDAVIAKGWVNADSLFVTGGSGGGVLTAWIVGHTHRFRAAVVQKPVINWYSWVLTSDLPSFGMKYWFTGPPWENEATYMKYSPISYVGNVTTPTMMITGEVDYRTPSGEAEQFYSALQLRKVPSALVRIPEASHEIAARPSHMMAKVAYVLGWFAKYGGPAN
jgi:dipeptidyl aminopeptidase/acylaminoacyl peptidase